jgi:hypothetical protein
MSDAAAAIFNGLSRVFPDMLPGKCFFHMIKSMRDRPYSDETSKNVFLKDLKSLSKSHSQNHFDASLVLFLAKYRINPNVSIINALKHFEKFWLTPQNIGWHSGLLPGTVTTNNGLEVTNRIFKKDLKGIFSFVSVIVFCV